MICDGCCLFFFKQKTAYEVRISDWSSDVALPIFRLWGGDSGPSSDNVQKRRQGHEGTDAAQLSGRGDGCSARRGDCGRGGRDEGSDRRRPVDLYRFRQQAVGRRRRRWLRPLACRRIEPRGFRSEEQTSELQSLMRISYAVFCLKKKTK